MTCPKCQSSMTERTVGDVSLQQCTTCQGLFLDRADLGALIEAENDFHRDTGPKTQPLPRITEDMAAPPPGRTRAHARAYLETLFG